MSKLDAFLKTKTGRIAAIAFLVLVLAACAWSYLDNKSQLESMLTAPQVGDVYFADLSRIDNSGYAADDGTAYGALKLVRKESDGRFAAHTSDAANESRSSFYRDWRDVTFSPVDEEPVLLSREDLVQLVNDGIIHTGERENASR